MDSGASSPNDHGAPAYSIPIQSLNKVNPQLNGWNSGDDSNGVSKNPERLRRGKRLGRSSPEKLRRSKRVRRRKASTHAAPEEESEDEEGEEGEDPLTLIGKRIWSSRGTGTIPLNLIAKLMRSSRMYAIKGALHKSVVEYLID
jgi:hypothetical protein